MVHRSPTYPIHDPPRPVVATAFAQEVQIGPARHSANEEIRGHDAVTGVGEGLFEGNEGEEYEVGEQVEAQGGGGEKCG